MKKKIAAAMALTFAFSMSSCSSEQKSVSESTTEALTEAATTADETELAAETTEAVDTKQEIPVISEDFSAEEITAAKRGSVKISVTDDDAAAD